MVAASSIEGGLKMTSEGMSSSAGGQFGSGTLGRSGMVSNLVLNSTEIKPPFSLLVQKKSLSEAVAKQFRQRMMITERRLRFRPLRMEYPGALHELTS